MFQSFLCLIVVGIFLFLFIEIFWQLMSCSLMLPDILAPYTLQNWFFFHFQKYCGYFALVLFSLKTLVISSVWLIISVLCVSFSNGCPYHSFDFLLSPPIQLYFCYWHFRFFTSFKNLPCFPFFLNYSYFILVFFLHICLFHQVCPDWESNPWDFSAWDYTPMEPHQPGQ